MKICIDARNLVFESHWAGTSLLTFRLIESLLKIDPSNSYTLYFNFLRGRLLNRVPALRGLNARMRVLRLPRKYADPLCDQWHFPIDLVTGSFDLLHGPAYELLYHRRGRSVVSIHDLTFHLHPEWLGSDWRDHFIEDVRSAINRADLFITISRYIKGEMVEHLGIPEEKIVITYPGVEERFTSRRDDNEKRTMVDRYGIREPYLLSVATQEPKKNLSGLLRAYRILKDRLPDVPTLVLVGKSGWESTQIHNEIKEHTLQDHILVLGYIPNDDLPRLYRYAELFLFPSFYEGFGMPILEAMASGCPVLGGRAAAIPEVTGDAAILVDPHSPEEMATAIEEFLSDEGLQRELRERGRARAGIFTWEETARKTLEAYRSLM